MKKIKVGQIVALEFGRLAVVKELFPYGDETLANTHYIDISTGNLMECPDKVRCNHGRTCPIHGRNSRFNEVTVVNDHDLDFMVKEAMISAELVGVAKAS